MLMMYNWRIMVLQYSDETEDDFIVDLVIKNDKNKMKTGTFCS
jgi:enolase